MNITAILPLDLKMFILQQIYCVNKRYGNRFGSGFFNVPYKVLIEGVVVPNVKVSQNAHLGQGATFCVYLQKVMDHLFEGLFL